MDELATELRALRDELSPAWTEERGEQLFAAIGTLQRRRKLQRTAFGASAGLLCVALALVGLSQRQKSQHFAAEGASAAPAPVARAGLQLHAGDDARLADGSLATVLGERGTLDVVRDDARHVALRLHAGAAHFEVVPNPQRQFSVDAGAARVFVVGTVFDVERAADRVRVAVSVGRVRIEDAAGEHFLSAGEARWFGAPEPVAAPEPPPAPEPELAAPAADRPRRAAHRDGAGAKVAWRSLCQTGDYEGAYRELAQGTKVEDDPAALMDAADAARLSGHPDVAVSYLRRVARDHERSPVAQLAAFTLGRVLLERLGNPSDAAEAFALARRLSPSGSLVQDALAREVEALSKAGDARTAYLRAQQYVQRYPRGQRLRAVQLYGGLE